MEFDPFVAIRLTPYHASRTGWPHHLGKVFGVLGFRTRNPTAKEFVMAVREWQQNQPTLAADGLLGVETWEKLRPLVRAYTGPVAAGTRPDWVDIPASDNDLSPPPLPKSLAPRCAEDRALLTLLRDWTETDAMTKAGGRGSRFCRRRGFAARFASGRYGRASAVGNAPSSH
jgi:hypothetical protein